MQRLTSFIVAAGAVALLAFASFATSPVLAGEEMSRAVGVPLKEAQEAIKKKQWDAALAKIKTAQAVKDKKPNEDYAINELLGYVLTNQKNTAEAAKVFEANLNSGHMPADQQPARVKMLAGMYAQTGNTAKALEYGNRWLKSSPTDAEAALFVAQLQYKSNDCKSAIRNIQTAINAQTKSGRPPSENWLDLKLKCQHDLKDQKGMQETREQIVRNYPSKENWSNLLTTIAHDPEISDSAKLNTYRLMLELGVLKDANVYSEMAQIALENNMPAEAVSIMQKGFDSKVLETDKNKDRHVRLLNQAKAKAQGAQSELATLTQQAAADPKGDTDVKLGGAFMSAGEYDKAVEAIQRGIKKGVKNADEAQMTLGRAYLKLNRNEEARKAFSAVPDYSKLAQVADLWKVYASQQPERTAQQR